MTTLLHTKGSSEVLESLKMRAQKKATQLARQPVTHEFTALLRKLPNIAVTQVTLACDDVSEEMAGSLTVEEDEELTAVFAGKTSSAITASNWTRSEARG